MKNRFGDPVPLALSLFGFSLVLLGFQFVVTQQVAGAALYAVLVAGILETAAAMLVLIRNETYIATIMGTFGMWLVGFYLLLSGNIHLINPKSIGLYILALLGPIAYMSIPAFRNKLYALQIGFVALFMVNLLLGIGAIENNATIDKVGGLFAFIAAADLWYAAFERLNAATRAPAESTLPSATSPLGAEEG